MSRKLSPPEWLLWCGVPIVQFQRPRQLILLLHWLLVHPQGKLHAAKVDQEPLRVVGVWRAGCWADNLGCDTAAVREVPHERIGGARARLDIF